jgi:16S rRNA (guanine966-N2)-methyltransferase
MRIIAGEFRGRPLAAPKGAATRPTASRVREALFDILAHGIGFSLDGAVVLDAFAGAGALGLEALSRGAESVVFMDHDRAAGEIINQNIETLGVTGLARVIACDVSAPPRAAPESAAQLLFLDPPYGKGLVDPALKGLAGRGWLAEGAVLVIEYGADERLDLPEAFTELDRRHYGAAALLFARFNGGQIGAQYPSA